jgi:ZU5 domain
MIRSRFLRSSVLVLSAFVALSCSDSSPTAPAAAPVSAIRAGTQQDALLGGLIGGLLKTVLSIVGFQPNANVPVKPVSWSPSYAGNSYGVRGTITSQGGTLTIPQTDFTITFPRGAVSAPTLITITSDPAYAAYKMEPHMAFARPVVVTQRLRHTTVSGQPLSSPLFGAYVEDAGLLGGLFKALEIELSATLSAPGSSTLPELTTWTVNHFSRYMLASG